MATPASWPSLSGTLVAATPLIFAALGELVAERAGVLNLGVEGMMLVGAVTASASRSPATRPWSRLPRPRSPALAHALVFAVLALNLATNQFAAGLALTIFGSACPRSSAIASAASTATSIAKLHLPLLSDLPVARPAALQPRPAGLSGAAGHRRRVVVPVPHPGRAACVRASASRRRRHTLSAIRSLRIRYLAAMFGGAMAGLGGAYLSLAYTPMWVEDMTAGRGWIALALVVFSTWRPWRLVMGAWLFGGITVLQLFAQGIGIQLPSELLSALPYLATIAVLVLISRNRLALLLNTPLSLAQPFRPER